MKKITKQTRSYLITHSLGYLSGLLFGLGVIISHMVNPAKVMGFLDVFGSWDPSLAFVMLSAITVASPAFWLAKKYAQTHKHALNNEPIQLPQRTKLTIPLIMGSALFGAGWGLSGLCPGPAIVAAATGNHQVVLFLVTLFFGFYLFEWYDKITS